MPDAPSLPLPHDESLAGTHLFIACAGLLVAGFLAWAHFGTLDVVANAGGEVVPSSQVKSVQHLEGGIVSEIMVREGEEVTRDQPLMTLEATATDAQVEELSVRLVSLRLDIARLEAEAAAEPSFPADVVAGHPDEVRAAAALFHSRRDRFQASISGLQQQLAQREQAMHEVGARLRNARNSLGLLNEQVNISESLLKEELSNRYTHLALLRDRSALLGRIEEDSAGLRRAELAVGEAKAQIEQARLAYDQEVKEHLATARRDFDEFSQRQRRLADSRDRTVLRAPVDGVVKTLYVVTRGGVVKPGQTVMDIVPAGDRLIVEARLPTYDIGYVRAGQDARIRLASSEAARFGGIDGTVVEISPDTLVNDKGSAYYRVRIRTASDHFQNGALRYQLYPGVQVEASIVTGRRTVLQYLLDPFIGYAGRAMRER